MSIVMAGTKPRGDSDKPELSESLVGIATTTLKESFEIASYTDNTTSYGIDRELLRTHWVSQSTKLAGILLQLDDMDVHLCRTLSEDDIDALESLIQFLKTELDFQSNLQQQLRPFIMEEEDYVTGDTWMFATMSEYIHRTQAGVLARLLEVTSYFERMMRQTTEEYQTQEAIAA